MWAGSAALASAAGNAAGGGGIGPGQATGAPSPRETYYQFPEGFLWGCATAAYQVEGGAKDGGRGPSIWDTFSHIPGKVHNNDTGDVADDHYHLYKEDVRLLKSLGAKVYRFSVSWPRIFPQGTGAPNPEGVDFYNRLVDELLANGIQPYCTLFHWDLPQALEDRAGGWQSRETAQAFGEYAGYVASRLSDRVQHFFTTNEFSSFIDLGYRDGKFAPGLKLPPAGVNQARHNAVLAGRGLAGEGDVCHRERLLLGGHGGARRARLRYRPHHVSAELLDPSASRGGGELPGAGVFRVEPDG